jgi:hypothetical protein
LFEDSLEVLFAESDEDDPSSAEAKATAGRLPIAEPIPKATATAPTRPICLAYPMRPEHMVKIKILLLLRQRVEKYTSCS